MSHKLLVDILLILSLLFLMTYELIGALNHELTGILMFILFIIHHVFNKNYLINLNKGKKSCVRYYNNSLIILISFCFIGSMISGIISSRHLFTFLNLKSNYVINRIHMLSAYWDYVFMSMHLGCHFQMFKLILINKKVLAYKYLKIFHYVILIYGIYAFFKLDIINYLFLKNQFFILGDNEHLIVYLFNYVAIMYLFAYLSMNIKKYLSKYRLL